MPSGAAWPLGPIQPSGHRPSGPGLGIGPGLRWPCCAGEGGLFEVPCRGHHDSRCRAPVSAAENSAGGRKWPGLIAGFSREAQSVQELESCSGRITMEGLAEFTQPERTVCGAPWPVSAGKQCLSSRPSAGRPPGATSPRVCFVNMLEQRLLAPWGVLWWVVQPPRGQPLTHAAGETPPSRAAACTAKTVGFSYMTVFAGAKKKKKKNPG